MRPITILHLSDLHSGPSVSTEAANLMDRLLDDARVRLSRGHGDAERPLCDAVVVSGDIANDGEIKEYDNAELRRFFKGLVGLAGGQGQRMIFTPGNHDVFATMDTGFDIEPGDNRKRIDEKMSNDANRRRLAGKFENFWKFVAEIRGDGTEQPVDRFHRAYPLLDVTPKPDEFEPIALQFIAINSAINCGKGGGVDATQAQDPKTGVRIRPLVVTEHQCRAALGDADEPLRSRKRHPLRIVVMHHPPLRLDEYDGYLLRRDLARNRVSLVLHGHSHITEGVDFGSSSMDLVFAAAGSATLDRTEGFARSYSIHRICPVTGHMTVETVIHSNEEGWHDAQGFRDHFPVRIGPAGAGRRALSDELSFLSDLQRLIRAAADSDDLPAFIDDIIARDGFCHRHIDPADAAQRGDFLLMQQMIPGVLSTTRAPKDVKSYQQGLRIPDGRAGNHPTSVAGEAYVRGEPMLMPNLDASPFVHPIRPTEGYAPAKAVNCYQPITRDRGYFGSLLCVPIRSRLGVKGVLNYQNSSPLTPDRRQIARMDLLCSVLGMLDHKIAIEHALLRIGMDKASRPPSPEQARDYENGARLVLHALVGQRRPGEEPGWVAACLDDILGSATWMRRGGSDDFLGVILDIDNVLLDTRTYRIAAIEAALRHEAAWTPRLSELDPAYVASRIVQVDLSLAPAHYFDKLMVELKIQETRVRFDAAGRDVQDPLAIQPGPTAENAARIRRLVEDFRKRLQHAPAVRFPEVDRMLAQLQAKHYRIGIVSGRPADEYSDAQRDSIAGLAERLDLVGPVYPVRGALEASLSGTAGRLVECFRGVAGPGNAVYVSATGDAIKAANGAGLPTVVALWGIDPDDQQCRFIREHRWAFPLPQAADIESRFPRVSSGRLFQIQQVLFDLDNTLIDVRDLTIEAYRRVLEVEREVLLAEDLSGPAERVIENILRRSGNPTPQQIVERREEFRSLLQRPEWLKAHLRPVPGAREVLLQIRQRTSVVAVVTGKPKFLAELHLQEAGLADLVDVMVAKGEAKPKPSPEGLRQAMDLVDRVRRERGWSGEPIALGYILYVGDSPEDIQAASNAKIQSAAAIWCPWAGRTPLHPETPEFLERQAEQVKASSPDLVLTTIDEVLMFLKP